MTADHTTYASIRDWQLRIVRRAGIELPRSAKVLDFGCGDGRLVQEYRAANYDAHGCDLASALGSGPYLAPILEPYRLPYEDSVFDFVVSNEVFEHVQNPRAAFAEIERILRPSGVSLHRFPSRYPLLETHTNVPLATLIQARPWLWLWALAGIRNEFQHGMSTAETVARNAPFLRDHTNYMRRRVIIQSALPLRVRFVEREAIETSQTRLRRLAPLAKASGRIYSGLRVRVLLLEHGRDAKP